MKADPNKEYHWVVCYNRNDGFYIDDEAAINHSDGLVIWNNATEEWEYVDDENEGSYTTLTLDLLSGLTTASNLV